MTRFRTSDRVKPDLEAMLREVARRESEQLVQHPTYGYLVLSRLGLLDREELDRLGEHLSLCVECAQMVLTFAARMREGEMGRPVAALVQSSAVRRGEEIVTAPLESESVWRPRKAAFSPAPSGGSDPTRQCMEAVDAAVLEWLSWPVAPAQEHADRGLPEPSGPTDERFVYQLTAAGKKALEECSSSR
jgi:hypothetical protein